MVSSNIILLQILSETRTILLNDVPNTRSTLKRSLARFLNLYSCTKYSFVNHMLLVAWLGTRCTIKETHFADTRHF